MRGLIIATTALSQVYFLVSTAGKRVLAPSVNWASKRRSQEMNVPPHPHSTYSPARYWCPTPDAPGCTPPWTSGGGLGPHLGQWKSTFHMRLGIHRNRRSSSSSHELFAHLGGVYFQKKAHQYVVVMAQSSSGSWLQRFLT